MIQYQGRKHLISDYHILEFRERMSFKTSEGERLSKTQIDLLVSKAKREFKEEALEEGKGYCWACGTNNGYRAASHIISVDKCQKDGRTEVAWNKDNLQLECNSPCHLETESGDIDHHANARYKKTFIEMYNNREI